MTEQEWTIASFADLWARVVCNPPTRKSDLLGVACARVFRGTIFPEVWAELEHIERRADDPAERSEDADLLDDGYGTNWLTHADDDLDGSLKALFLTHYDLRDFELQLPVPIQKQWSGFLRDIFGNPFRPAAFDPAWRTSTAVGLAQSMYAARDFAAMPVLADALQEAGCEHADILAHCRDETAAHVRGCWVVDLVLGKS